MADAERTLKVLRTAAIQLRATRGRRGMVVHLEEPGDVLIAGDLHGHVDNLKAVIQMADLIGQPRRHLVLQELVHGTHRYPNGGCTSHRVLDLACLLAAQFPNRVHLLLGNHEFAEWTGRSIGKQGVQFNELFALGVSSAYGDRATEVLEAYRQIYASMPLAVQTRNRVFACHSLPSAKALGCFDSSLFAQQRIAESQLKKGSCLYHLLWDRDYNEETARRFADMVHATLLVTGHIRCPNGFLVPNSRQVIVDCSGRPAGVVIFSICELLTHEKLVESVQLLGSDMN
jgi:hypothetical protein